MPETATILVGSGKPDHSPMPEKQAHPVVAKTKELLSKWWENAGPKGIEDQFVEAHKKVLATLSDPKRQEAYAKTEDNWRTAGKIVGVASTITDFALVGFGAFDTTRSLQNPFTKEGQLFRAVYRQTDIHRQNPANWVETTKLHLLQELYSRFIGKPAGVPDPNPDTARYLRGDRVLASLPALGSLANLAGIRPGHMAGAAIGWLAEQGGKTKAHLTNYVDSGKALEHATKAGKAVGKGLEVTGKYVAEHPEQVQNLIKTASDAHRDQQILAERQKVAAEIRRKEAVEQEFATWKSDEMSRNKAYYDLSGTKPTREEFDQWKKNKEESERAAAKAEGRKPPKTQ
jgi:hypothetical protein